MLRIKNILQPERISKYLQALPSVIRRIRLHETVGFAVELGAGTISGLPNKKAKKLNKPV